MKFSSTQTIGILMVVLIIIVGVAVYAFPPSSMPVTITLTTTANSTVSIIKQETTTATLLQSNTVTQVVTSSVTSISTLSTATKTMTQNATFTITQQVPTQVGLSGNVESKLPLTSAVQIRFVASTGITYPAKVTGGTYSITLPNHDTYQVNIDYSINPVGSGSCWAGQLPLDTMKLTQLIAWAC